MKNFFNMVIFLLISANISAQNKNVAPDLESDVQKAAGSLQVEEPNLRDPVALNAAIIFGKDKKQFAVILKVKVLRNWHIYAYVPDSQPYIQTELKLSAPEGVTELGDWHKPAAYPSSDGVFVYEGNMVFVRYFSVEKLGTEKELNVGLFYQTCDLQQCLAPNTKMKKLLLNS